jgi:site-specific DNA-methyltransferase (adenine-specific)
MDMMKRYPDGHFDLAIVDPPYGDAGGGQWKNQPRSRFGGRFDKYHISHAAGGGRFAKYGEGARHWDIAPGPEYFEELFRVSKRHIIWGGNYFKLPPSRNFIVWRKLSISQSFSMAMVEQAWTDINGNAKYFECIPQEKGRFHPTEKPVKLYAWLLATYAKPGWHILDTHMGSGTIALACWDAGYDLTATEIDPDYYAKATARIEDHKRERFLFDQQELLKAQTESRGLFDEA